MPHTDQLQQNGFNYFMERVCDPRDPPLKIVKPDTDSPDSPRFFSKKMRMNANKSPFFAEFKKGHNQ